jgi:hypothetical protein
MFFLMSVNFCITIQCHIPEDSTVYSHHCECSNPTQIEIAKDGVWGWAFVMIVMNIWIP